MGAFSLEGNDWLGLGSALSKNGTAVRGCGARPNCLFGSDCNASKERFDDCVSTQQQINAKNSQANAILNDKAITADQKHERNKTIIYVVIGIVVFIILMKTLG